MTRPWGVAARRAAAVEDTHDRSRQSAHPRDEGGAPPTSRRHPPHVPVYAGGRQIGRATSGTFSPTLKKHIALASVDAAYEPAGSDVQLEWTVEGRRGRVAATVAALPFFDPPRKRG